MACRLKDHANSLSQMGVDAPLHFARSSLRTVAKNRDVSLAEIVYLKILADLGESGLCSRELALQAPPNSGVVSVNLYSRCRGLYHIGVNKMC